MAGTVVQFNVIATNGVGDSKPSDTSSMYYVIGDFNVDLHNDNVFVCRPSKTAQKTMVPRVH